MPAQMVERSRQETGAFFQCSKGFVEFISFKCTCDISVPEVLAKKEGQDAVHKNGFPERSMTARIARAGKAMSLYRRLSANDLRKGAES